MGLRTKIWKHWYSEERMLRKIEKQERKIARRTKRLGIKSDSSFVSASLTEATSGTATFATGKTFDGLQQLLDGNFDTMRSGVGRSANGPLTINGKRCDKWSASGTLHTFAGIQNLFDDPAATIKTITRTKPSVGALNQLQQYYAIAPPAGLAGGQSDTDDSQDKNPKIESSSFYSDSVDAAGNAAANVSGYASIESSLVHLQIGDANFLDAEAPTPKAHLEIIEELKMYGLLKQAEPEEPEEPQSGKPSLSLRDELRMGGFIDKEPSWVTATDFCGGH